MSSGFWKPYASITNSEHRWYRQYLAQKLLEPTSEQEGELSKVSTSTGSEIWFWDAAETAAPQVVRGFAFAAALYVVPSNSTLADCLQLLSVLQLGKIVALYGGHNDVERVYRHLDQMNSDVITRYTVYLTHVACHMSAGRDRAQVLSTLLFVILPTMSPFRCLSCFYYLQKALHLCVHNSEET